MLQVFTIAIEYYNQPVENFRQGIPVLAGSKSYSNKLFFFDAKKSIYEKSRQISQSLTISICAL